MSKEMVKQETGEVLSASPFELKQSEPIIFVEGFAVEYRNDCSKAGGKFKIGESQILGDSLDMIILSYPEFEAEMLDYEKQNWIEFLFLDKDKAISTCLIKGQSIERFKAYLLQLTIQKKAIATVVTRAKMVEKNSKQYGKYYIVDFENSGDVPAETLKELQKFWVEKNSVLSNSFRFAFRDA
jgi:hypothetical protein